MIVKPFNTDWERCAADEAGYYETFYPDKKDKEKLISEEDE